MLQPPEFRFFSNHLIRHLDQHYSGLLTDLDITSLCEDLEQGPPLLDPFLNKQVKSNEKGPILSKGLTSCGYDLTLGREFRIFTLTDDNLDLVINPLQFDETCLRTVFCDEDHFLMEPKSYVLAHSLEYISMPINVFGICNGKSTLARSGIHVNVTPLEPGWKGHLTLEIANHTDFPVMIFPDQGICQINFFSTGYIQHHYGNRPGGPGKYQNQGAHVQVAKA